MKTFATTAPAAALACMLAGPAAAAADPALQGKKVPMALQTQAQEKTADEQLRKLLESRGLVVTLADQSDPAGRAQGQDLVLASSRANGNVMGERLRKLAAPVLACQPELLGELGMTGPRLESDHGLAEKKDHYLYVVNAPSPLAGGLPAGTFVSTAKSVQMNRGKPSLAAQVVMTPPGCFGTPMLFGYEKGATLEQGDAARARRASFHLGSEAFEKNQPTPAKPALFGAVLRWTAAGGEQPPQAGAPAKGSKMLLVVQKVSDHHKAEVRDAVQQSNAAMLDHFKSLGFDVAVADQTDPAALADGKDLVLISATVKANVLGGRFKDAKVPVVTLENDALDDMDMSPKRRGADFGDTEDPHAVKPVNAPHPLCASLPAGAVEMFKSGVGLGWGVPSRAATTIATVQGAPDKAALFAYEKGATMDHEVLAPVRRVYLPVDYNAWRQLTPSGMKLIASAPAWTIVN